MAAMASRAFPVTPEIAIEDLITGYDYRMEHRRGEWPTKTGKFSGHRTDDPKCAYFLSLNKPKDGFFSCTNDWTFHNSEYSESINMISKSKSLPNEVQNYLKTFGGSMKKTKRSRRTRRRTRRQTRRR
jgi:hypothetical protein